ncbi:MAG: sigma-70 family RNA polymerase sigma factor [Pseudarcicella sp.]|nr:sigma-70 family RNA polymerase sigma factor [Pseudarcicella sp.]MBP6411648.1 sigma-70 family RNA polymerase sigma factor [Pseudarcicella sp.]
MAKNHVNDSELISLYINGNDRAFETLVQRYKSKVYTTIYLIVKDSFLAEDLTQDVFIKAVDVLRSGKYNEEGKFLPWLLRIAHNMAIDNFRRNKRYPTVVFEDGSQVFNSFEFAEESYEDLQIKSETYTNLRELFKKLPDHQREVLVMRHFEEMSFQEIADTTGVSINTALGRMRYALINLRKMMTQNSSSYDTNFYTK